MKHAQGTTTLEDFQYQFNAANNITQMTDGAGAHNYGYDVVNRITSATHPSTTNESYSFDDVGNRTSSQQGSSYGYQAYNRLVSANSNSYSYDTNGNMISKTDASGSWTYTWDYENRLKQSAKSGGATVSYSYDALGRRIQRSSSSGSTTKFIYDGADVLRDLNADGSTAADYLNGLGIDNKLRQTTGGTTSYFVTDHLSTTRALTDASGSVTSTLSYDSFGNLTIGSAPTRYTYTGRESEADSGLLYYRARWYDPQMGRFISEDPIGFLGRDANLYGYVHNDPLRFVDPSGLRRCHPLLGAIVGGLLGAGTGAGGGAVLGAIAGGTVGALGGSFVIPGLGTIAVGAGGVLAGTQAGAIVGSAVGAGIGIGVGIDYCNGDDAKPRCETTSTPMNPPTPPDRERHCDRILYQIDYPRCDAAARSRGPAAYSRCMASAHQRYAA